MEPTGDAPKKTASVRQLLRQQRELEEKRKFGLAPLAVDTESHQEISPNIPQFISRAPWYYGASGPTLAHQRKQDSDSAHASDDVLHDTVDRIVVKGQAAHFTAGACKNCGSRTHKTTECFQAKKKVGSVYTNRVTGVDLETVQHAKTYAQKRDRFVGDVGVDLMRGVRQDSDGAEDAKHTKPSGSSSSSTEGLPPGSRHRPEDVFGTRTAQHGGLEVKELPKYLHNLDDHDGLFFDPKTGSMRANPNATDSTKTFQGDLERYRSGDYYNYVEAQHRFLTGQSSSFVDFDFDDAMRRARELEAKGPTEGAVSASAAAAVAAPETAQDVLLRSLYGAPRPTAKASAPDGDAAPQPSASSSSIAPTASSPAAVPVAPGAPAEPAVSAASASSDGSLIANAALHWVPTRNGHRAVYGSFFDAASFRWGYACCRATAKDAPGCVPE